MVLSAFTSIKMFALDIPKSASKTATLKPFKDKLIAELIASEVFPTPPLPLTKANDWTIELPTFLLS
jgi:hypothetical protein